MAMTSATLFASAPVDNTSKVNSNPAAVSIATLAGDKVYLQVKVTTGATAPGVNGKIDCYLAFAETTQGNAGTMPDAMRPSAIRFSVPLVNLASVTRMYTSEFIFKRGDFAHFWFDQTATTAGVTLEVLING